ncbi:MAG: hypothetical protein PVJ57_10855 [Phycisphaerae bacterium]
MTDVVPEYWESTPAEPPVQARPVGYLLFLPILAGLLLIPARLGPRLVRSSPFKAVLAHGLALLLTVVPPLLAIAPRWPWDIESTLAQSSFLERVRVLGVVGVEMSQALVGAYTVWPFLITLLAAHAACWILAWGLVPFVGDAGSRWRTFGQCLKLTLWSSILFVPASAGLAGVIVLRRKTISFAGDVDYWLVLFWLVLLAVCWMYVLLRLGSRVPRLGREAVERRSPHCVGCRYQITGLPITGRCPECGLELAASLPTARSQPPWFAARGLEGRFRAFFGTTWQILRQPHYFRTLAVRDGRSQAVGFAVRMCWIVAIWHFLVCAAPLDWALLRDVGLPQYWPTATLLFGGLFLGVLLITMLAGGIAAFVTCRFGWRDPRPTTVLTGYAAALFLPLGLLLPVCAVGLALSQWHLSPDNGIEEPALSALQFAQACVLPVVFLSPMAALYFAVRRYARGLRDIRNALD